MGIVMNFGTRDVTYFCDICIEYATSFWVFHLEQPGSNLPRVEFRCGYHEATDTLPIDGFTKLTLEEYLVWEIMTS